MLARQALVEIVTRRELPASIPHEGIFGERRGVFVTLHVGGELRGCIGTTEGDEPLGDAVVRCAASAALHDPRFAAVRAEELSGCGLKFRCFRRWRRFVWRRLRLGSMGW